MSLAASLCHLEWHERKINLVDTPGDPGFQADTLASLRVVEGALMAVNGVNGVEVQTTRLWERAEALDLCRVLFVTMLDRERADFFAALEQLRSRALRALRGRADPDRARARAQGHRRPLPHERVPRSGRRARGHARGHPGRHRGAGGGVSGEARGGRRRDGRGDHGALSRRRGDLRRRARRRAQERRRRGPALPRHVRRPHEEPRHDRAPRPARRGHPVAGQEADGRGRRRRRPGRVRLQDRRRPLRGPDQPLPRALRARSRPTRRSSTRAPRTRSASASCSSFRGRTTSRRTSSARATSAPWPS